MFYSDIHIYYFQNNPFQLQFAKELWERIRRECASSPSSSLFSPC